MQELLRELLLLLKTREEEERPLSLLSPVLLLLLPRPRAELAQQALNSAPSS